MVCRFFPEDGGPSRDFDFSAWPVSRSLRLAFLGAFAQLTAADGTHRSERTAETTFSACQRLAQWLAIRDPVPTRPVLLTGALIAEYRMAKPRDYIKIRRLLLLLSDLPVSARAVLSGANPRRRSNPVVSYQRAEMSALMAAARKDVRAAAGRIREARALLEQWLAEELDPNTALGRRGRILEHVAREGDVPRLPGGKIPGWVSELGSVTEHVAALHLTAIELTSAAVLLVGLTGHNATGISTLRVVHQRTDGDFEQSSGPSTRVAVVDVIKGRRGRRRRYMSVPLTDVPDWLAKDDQEPVRAPSGEQLRLDTAFGVYILLHELTADSRAACGTDRLLVARAIQGGKGVGRHWVIGIKQGHSVGLWSDKQGLEAPPVDGTDGPDAKPWPLRVTWPRLRRTFVEQHQRGVAHTDATLANQYLVPDRGNVTAYQQVVADTLALQEERARQYSAIKSMTAVDLAQFGIDPHGVASRFGVDRGTIERLLAGRLDTALAGCVDNEHSPFTERGPCRVSFLLCLGCRNARATPQHLPTQIETLRRLQELRTAMAPDRWARRFGLAEAQLQHLLKQFPGTVVDAARADIDDETRNLVGRLLDGQLDVT